MSKRRGSGEGSIYQRKDGRWVASISLGGRKRKSFYGHTRKEVQEKMKVALREQQQAILVTSKNQKLGPYLEQWLDMKRPSLEALSAVAYGKVLRRYLLPDLGHLTLQGLTPWHVQQFYGKLQREDGLAPATIHQVHAVLHLALDQAVKWNLVARNVCDLVQTPQSERTAIRVLTIEEATRLIEAATGQWKTLLLLAVTTGMREGEILGLHWEDIEFEARRLFVRRTVARVGTQGIQESSPKTRRSRRTLTLPEVTLAALRGHRLSSPIVGPLVFPNTTGGYIATSTLWGAYRRILERAELPPLRFHDLRHSAGSILLSQGVSIKVVQEILGHSTISMTMDVYGHLLPGMQEEAMGTWDTLLGDGEASEKNFRV